jgi:hypothetical protein
MGCYIRAVIQRCAVDAGWQAFGGLPVPAASLRATYKSPPPISSARPKLLNRMNCSSGIYKGVKLIETGIYTFGQAKGCFVTFRRVFAHHNIFAALTKIGFQGKIKIAVFGNTGVKFVFRRCLLPGQGFRACPIVRLVVLVIFQISKSFLGWPSARGRLLLK